MLCKREVNLLMIEITGDIAVVSVLSSIGGALLTLSTKYGVKVIFDEYKEKRKIRRKYNKDILKKVYVPISKILDQIYTLNGSAQLLPREAIGSIIDVLYKESILVESDSLMLEMKYTMIDWYYNLDDKYFDFDRLGYMSAYNKRYRYLCRENSGKLF